MTVPNNKPLKATILETPQATDANGELNSYAESLGLARITNPSDQYRINRVSLENLLARIIDRYQRNDLSEKQRNELFKLLPTLVERAISNAHTEQLQPGNPTPALDPLLETGKREEIARLERLKNQYFQNAREYVKIGNYQYALVEVRRMYIVDPDNPVARQYEKWIEQLARLQNQQLKEPDAAPAEKVIEAEVVRTPEPEQDPDSDEAILMQVEQEVRGEPQPRAPLQQEGGARFPLVTLIMVFLAVGGGVYLYRLVTGKNSITAPAYLRSILPPPEQEQPNELETPNVLSPASPTPVVKNPQKDVRSLAKESYAPAKQRPRQFFEPETFSPSPVEHYNVGPAAANDQASVSTLPASPVGGPTNNSTEITDNTSNGEQQFVALEKPPQVLKLATPYYPEAAYRAGLEGEVLVKTKIDPSGRPEVAVILKSSSPIFDNAAIEALMNSEFSAGYMSTGPVTAWIVVPLKFKLSK
jgi:TonB family protein